jgi:hypothetical protein
MDGAAYATQGESACGRVERTLADRSSPTSIFEHARSQAYAGTACPDRDCVSRLSPRARRRISERANAISTTGASGIPIAESRSTVLSVLKYENHL